jgi:hypothetical protein
MSDEVGQEVAEVKESTPSLGKKLIIYATVLLPILGYLIGNGYHASYLSAFGVTSGVFQLSIQDTYINAYQSITWNLINFRDLIRSLALSDLIRSAAYLLVFIVIMTAINVLNTRHVSKIVEAIDLPSPLRPFVNSAERFTPLAGFVVMVISMFILTLTIPFLLFISWMLLYLLSYSQGKAIAEKQIAEYQENKGCYFKEDKRWGNCTQLIDSNGHLLYEGILVVQNDKRVAFYNGKESVILEIPERASIRNLVNAELDK